MAEEAKKDVFKALLKKIRGFETELTQLKVSLKVVGEVIKEVDELKELIYGLHSRDEKLNDKLQDLDDKTDIFVKIGLHMENLNKWKDKMDGIDIHALGKSVSDNKKDVGVLKNAVKKILEKPEVKPSLISGSSVGTAAGIAGAVIIEYLVKQFGGK